jgi:hypothetical protein
VTWVKIGDAGQDWMRGKIWHVGEDVGYGTRFRTWGKIGDVGHGFEM